jgi:lysophospholipase L1-like esterase
MTNKIFLRPKLLWLLLLVWAAGVGCASTKSHPSFSRWETTIAAFEASDKTNPPPKNAVLFIGASNFVLWTNLVTDFPDEKVFNRAFGGSFMQDILFYADRIVLPYAPRVIVLQAGGNDIHAGHTPEEVFADFKALAEIVRARLPNTRLVFVSVPPCPKRSHEIPEVRETNRLIADYIDRKSNLVFVNIFPLMQDANGLPDPKLYKADGMHVNDKGYAIWKEMIEPQLK